MTILHELRQRTNKPIELIWNNQELSDISAIEVYPTATLKAYGILHRGYREHKQYRREIIKALKNHIYLSEGTKILRDNADALDSAVCLLAAKDFLEGKSYEPENLELAKKEGWIWVRKINS